MPSSVPTRPQRRQKQPSQRQDSWRKWQRLGVERQGIRNLGVEAGQEGEEVEVVAGEVAVLLQEVVVPLVAVVVLLQEAVVLLLLVAVEGLLQEAVGPLPLVVVVGTPIPITRIRTLSRTRDGCRGGGVPGSEGGLSGTRCATLLSFLGG
jgi:hypothetical protein